jgi:phosphatidylinositol glycan class B
LTLRTFFQPDEFFQSLEPAWQLAFGPNAQACITWVNAHTHTCCPSSCLTLFAGVGRSIALVPAPRPVRCHLPSGRRAG